MEEQHVSDGNPRGKQYNQPQRPPASPWMWVAIASMVLTLVFGIVMIFALNKSSSSDSSSVLQGQGPGVNDSGPSCTSGSDCSDIPPLDGARNQPNVQVN